MNPSRATTLNLHAGRRLATFRRVELSDFCFSLNQVLVLAGVNIILSLLWQYIAIEPQRHFNQYSIPYTAGFYLVLFLSAYLITTIKQQQRLITAFLVMWLSAYPYLQLAAFLQVIIQQNTETGFSASLIIFLFAIFWELIIVYKIIWALFQTRVKSGIALLLVYTGMSGLYLYSVPQASFWYSERKTGLTEKAVNTENLYYQQGPLLEMQLSGLAQSRKGFSDIYFVGMGAYSYEDVFKNEVIFARNLFDKEFGTKSRSLVLVNNLDTTEEYPTANAHNLAATLNRVASLMDKDEDVLFLFITSHGSREHVLSITMDKMFFNPLPAGKLKKILDNSGIRNRIIVISSCYSGGFIDALKDDHSLIITAARKDRTSFGCSNDEDYTYFGRAFFVEQLNHEKDFILAFKNAKKQLTEKERKKNLEHSEPQIYIGKEIQPLLNRIQQQLQH